MKAVFAQVCAVGNSWVSQPLALTLGYSSCSLLLCLLDQNRYRKFSTDCTKWEYKSFLWHSPILYPFFKFFQWHTIALVCLFREEESSAFLVSRAGIVCDTWAEEGRKKLRCVKLPPRPDLEGLSIEWRSPHAQCSFIFSFHSMKTVIRSTSLYQLSDVPFICLELSLTSLFIHSRSSNKLLVKTKFSLCNLGQI